MRWLWLGIALAACGTASEGVSTSTATILGAEAETDGGTTDASADADTDAGPTMPTDPLPSVDDSVVTIPGPSHRVNYTPAAPFTAIMFTATAGQDVGLLVDTRTGGAKPAAWVTDNQFVSIVSKNTGSGSVFLRFTADRTGLYYLVIRERALQPATFLVTPFDFTPPDAGAE